MNKLRPCTKEEHNAHARFFVTKRQEAKILEEGYKEGFISKSQMKKGLAQNHNEKVQYIEDNKIEIFMGHIYVQDETAIEVGAL